MAPFYPKGMFKCVLIGLLFFNFVFLYHYFKKSQYEYALMSKYLLCKDKLLSTNLEENLNQTDLSWLDENPIYSKYKIETIPRRKHVTIIVIISTAPRRLERRMAIRDTFWKECIKTKSVNIL